MSGCWEKFVWWVVQQQNRVPPSPFDFGLWTFDFRLGLGLGLWQQFPSFQICCCHAALQIFDRIFCLERLKSVVLILKWYLSKLCKWVILARMRLKLCENKLKWLFKVSFGELSQTIKKKLSFLHKQWHEKHLFLVDIASKVI